MSYQRTVFINSLALLLFLAGIGLLVYHFLYSKHEKPVEQSIVKNSQLPVKFDFYTVLPKMAVVANPAQDTVELQVAVFHDIDEANRLSLEMNQKGFHTFVKTYYGKDTTVHRVLIGPLNPDAAKHYQHQLRKLSIESFIIKY